MPKLLTMSLAKDSYINSGIDYHTLKWIEYFLTLRIQTVFVNGESLEKFVLHSAYHKEQYWVPYCSLYMSMTLMTTSNTVPYDFLQMATSYIKLSKITQMLSSSEKIYQLLLNGRRTGSCPSVLTSA